MTRTSTVALLLAAAVLWLLSHPYQGIYHDARVYGLLAARWLSPEALATDLFFLGGSQGSLSIFTPIYGLLVGQMGLDRAAQFVVLSGGLLWIWAVYCVSRTVLGEGLLFRFALLFGVSGLFAYSHNTPFFALSENFATARSWAIPLGLLGANFLLQRKMLQAAILAILSCLLHPLIGIWALLLLIATYLGERLSVIFGVLALLGVVMLGLMNPPIPGLRLMDPAWLASVREPQLDVLLGTNAASYLFWLACLLLGMRAGDQRWRDVYGKLALIAAIALATGTIASFWLPVEIVVQLQLWRAFWLAIPLGGLALLDVMRRSCIAYSSAWLGWSVIAALACLTPPVFSMLALLAMLVFFCRPVQHWPALCTDFIELKVRWVAPLSVVLWLLVLPGLYTSVEIAGGRFTVPWWEGAVGLHGLLAGGLWPLPLLLALLIGLPTLRFLPAVLAASALLWVLAHWDHRPVAKQMAETCYLANCPSHALSQYIPAGATVALWPENDLFVWFRLNAQNYASKTQGIGRVFSQAKYLEWRRREGMLSPLFFGDQGAGILLACTDPLLQWVVIDQMGLLPHKPFAEVYEDGRHWQLFRCRP